MSLVWINEQLHLQVNQIILPGFELLLCPQSPQKSLSVLHSKLEEEVAVAEEESTTQEEVASPQEDSAESYTGMYPINISLRSYGHIEDHGLLVYTRPCLISSKQGPGNWLH